MVKITDSLMSKMSAPQLGEDVMPKRKSDCPALPVCAFLHNSRQICAKGGPTLIGVPTEFCLASIVMLLARAQELPVGPDEEKVEKFKKNSMGYLNDLPE